MATTAPPREQPAPSPLLELDAELEAGNASPLAFRQALRRGTEELEGRFLTSEPVEFLVRDRAGLVDALLERAWRLHGGAHLTSGALVAVGGYGRGELHPSSDIDVMVLLPEDAREQLAEPLERFVTFLWDIGLEVGHSVRTVSECVRESRNDLTVVTTLMESRRLCGQRELYETMRAAVSPQRLWPSPKFFEAKIAEQTARHHRYHDTAYNLEPNVKGSPGGLRDIQVIGWVAKRHFGVETLDELVDYGFLTPTELRNLLAGQSFLWRIRFALHMITGRREDRLLFDYQVRLAQMFGYEDASYTLAVEQFMQRYYRTVMELSRLNEMLLQLLREAILMDPEAAPTPVNERFQVRNGYLQAATDEVFRDNPSALLEVFALLQENRELHGVSASTIRLIHRDLHLIDEEFRQSPRNHRLFLAILGAPDGVTHELRRMNLYGVLGRYILAFGRVVGRMQYDLFHAYTVDAHTLFVVSNLRRFALSRYDHEFPLCSQIMQQLPRPTVAYLAGLFHDIAKGRGGDHSELGAVDAEAFCLEQGMSQYDARLVAWLVRHHLILSVTAQKSDISDPKVIHDFATQVGDQTHLDHLYLLTVADVRGTNPKLWNSWKATLFEELYDRTKRALRRGLENPIDKAQLIAETQTSARALLDPGEVPGGEIEALWAGLTEEYFLRNTPREIAWHTRRLAGHSGEALVAIQPESTRGGTAILLYSPRERHTFARATAILDELGLNILDARIISTTDGHSLDSYHVLEDTGMPIDEARKSEMEQYLWRAVAPADGSTPKVTRRATRQMRMFATPTQIGFSVDPRNRRTIMELVAADRPGLLSEVGKAFMATGVELQTAKIMTVGERAEDVFFITDEQGRPLTPAACDELEAALRRGLDRARGSGGS